MKDRSGLYADASDTGLYEDASDTGDCSTINYYRHVLPLLSLTGEFEVIQR